MQIRNMMKGYKKHSVRFKYAFAGIVFYTIYETEEYDKSSNSMFNHA